MVTIFEQGEPADMEFSALPVDSVTPSIRRYADSMKGHASADPIVVKLEDLPSLKPGTIIRTGILPASSQLKVKEIAPATGTMRVTLEAVTPQHGGGLKL